MIVSAKELVNAVIACNSDNPSCVKEIAHAVFYPGKLVISTVAKSAMIVFTLQEMTARDTDTMRIFSSELMLLDAKFQPELGYKFIDVICDHKADDVLNGLSAEYVTIDDHAYDFTVHDFTTISLGYFKRLQKMTYASVDRTLRPYSYQSKVLNHHYLHSENGYLNTVSCDTHVLIHHKLKCESPELEVFIHHDTFKFMVRYLNKIKFDDDTNVIISSQEGFSKYFIKVDNITFLINRIDEVFPQYKNILNQNKNRKRVCDSTITIDRISALDSLRMMVSAGESVHKSKKEYAHVAKLHSSNGITTVSCVYKDDEVCGRQFGTSTGENTLWFNSSLLLGILRSVSFKSLVISTYGIHNPIEIRSGEDNDYIAILMPCYSE